MAPLVVVLDGRSMLIHRGELAEECLAGEDVPEVRRCLLDVDADVGLVGQGWPLIPQHLAGSLYIRKMRLRQRLLELGCAFDSVLDRSVRRIERRRGVSSEPRRIARMGSSPASSARAPGRRLELRVTTLP